jgi:outer membrane protein assembly factor BamE (lipoprotein component of BamABCDE complex)
LETSSKYNRRYDSMKNNLHFVALVAVLAGVCAAIVTLNNIADSRPGVTRANYERVKVGMAFDEVNELFGNASNEQLGMGRPWDYTRCWHAKDMSVVAITFHGNVFDENVKCRVSRKVWRGPLGVIVDAATQN